MKQLILLSFMFGALLNLVGQDVDDVIYSTERGFYSGPFSVALSADEPTANIFYSLDGSDPTPPNGLAYTSPLTITATSMLRAVAITATDTTKVFTHTYIFLNDVLSQMGTPPGYPSMWDGYPADYDMDNSYMSDPQVAPLMMDAMLEIPSLSIVMEFDDLFDVNTGLYQNTEERGNQWERPTSVELINPDNTTEFHINAGIRMHGASSRDPQDYKKHAMRLAFRDEYGPGRLNVPIFGPEGSDRINGLVLRMIANYSPNDIDPGRRGKPQFVKDQWAREAFGKMGHVTADGLFAHVYLNGIYWGIYNIHERIDAALLEEKQGGNKDTYDVLNAGNSNNGNDAAWIAMQQFAFQDINIPSDYDSLKKWIDMENYADYIILNHYGNNTDWPDANWYAARNREGGDLWKFYPWDSEFFFLNNYNFTRRIVFNKGSTQYNRPTVPFHKIKFFPEWKMLFSDRVECHCYDDGILEPDNALELFKDISEKVDTALHGEYARWGDVQGQLYTYFNHEVNTRNFIVNDFLVNARDSLISLYLEEGVISTLRSVQYSQDPGLVASNSLINLTNTNGFGSIFYTLDGTDPRTPNGGISANAVVYTSPIAISGLTEIRARVFDGAEWSAMCPKTFYTPQNYSDVVINEIHYNPTRQIFGMDTIDGDEFEYIELKNTGSQAVDISNCSFSYGIQYDFPFGTIIPPGGFLVVAENQIQFTALYGFDPIHQYESKLSNGGEMVKLFDPFRNIIDAIDYDDESPWPTFPDGDGLSLSLFVGANNNFISSWTYETALLTPLAENQFCSPSNWQITVAEPSGCASMDGEAQVSFPGLGYSIAWDHGPTTPAVSGLSAGIYPFMVTDPSGCTKKDSIIISSAITPSIVTNVTAALTNGTTAVITWSALSGISNYEISYREIGSSTWLLSTSNNGLTILNNINECSDYEVRVRAGCSGLYGPYSTIATFNSGNCFVCTAPAGLYDFNYTNISAIVTWDVLVGVTEYTVKYRKVGDASWISQTTPFPIAILFGIPSCSDFEWTIDATCINGSVAASTSIGNFSTLCKSDDIEPTSFDSDFVVYPNPADDIVNIFYSSEKESDILLDIISLSGQTVYSELRQDSKTNQWTIPASTFSSGEYIVRVKSAHNVRHEKLIIH